MPIDFTKPVQTRGGLPVRILCTDLKSEQYPVVGLVSLGRDGLLEVLRTFTLDGKYSTDCAEQGDDLINVPERHKHADLIIAWANGAKIQYYSNSLGKWRDTGTAVSWDSEIEYRIKPEE